MKIYTQKQADKLHGIYTHNELARLLNLLPFDDELGQGGECFDDNMWESVLDHALFSYAYERGYEYIHPYTIMNGEFEIDVDTIRDSSKLLEKYQDEAATELYSAWKRALESTVERILEYVDLTLQPCKINMVNDGYITDAVEIVPCKSWRETVIEVMNSSSGYYNNLTDFKDSFGTTDRAASIHAFESGEYGEWFGNKRRVESRMNDYLDHYLYSW